MGHLVADNHANGAIVAGFIGIGVKVRRLQDTGGEADLVARGLVIGINRLRGHEPALLVHGLVQLAVFILGLETQGVQHVLPVALSGVDVQIAVISPLVGIADLDGEAVELDQGVHLGLGAHPRQRGDVLTQSFLEVIHQLLHLLLGVGGEELLDIELAYGLAQHGVGHIERVFPARHLHLLARHGTAVHVEVGVGKRITQVGRSGIHILEDQILPHVLYFERFHHLVDFCQRLGLENAHLVELADIQTGKILAPVDVGIIGPELIQAHYIVELAIVTGLFTGHGHACQGRFNVHHALGSLLGISLLVADELEQLLDVIDIGIAHLGGIGVVFQVVVAVTHAQATLHEIHHVGVRVLKVGHDCRVEEWRCDAGMLVGDCGHELVTSERLVLVDAGLEGRHAFLVEAHTVHTHGIEVTHLLLDAATGIVGP